MVERIGLEPTTHSSLFLKKLFAVSAYLRKEWNMYPLVELKRIELLTS